jgi:hypothetical protein
VKKLLILLVSVGLGAVAICLFFVRPLIRSNDYRLSVTVDGNPAEAELLQPLLMSKLHYIRIPVGASKRLGWFGVTFARKSVSPARPSTRDGVAFLIFTGIKRKACV